MSSPARTPPDSQEPAATAGEPGPAAPTLARGTALGRYVVLEVLGIGGQGVVYGAYDPQLDRKVALKLVRVRAGTDANDEQQARLLAEAQVLARLSHPNVVVVHDVGRFAEQVFLAMEFMAGGTLGAWLETKPPLEAVLERFREAARGLAAAHSAGVVHRDFKPDNVLLDEAGVAHVTDFGLARVLDGSSVVGGGTAAWMSPEQRARRELTPASDQYSWCLALSWALTGVMPFEGGALEPRFPPQVPGWLRRVLLRGLATNPAERFPSMEAVLSAIATDPAQRRRRALRAGLLISGLVAVGVATGALVFRESPAERATRECLEHLEATLASTFGPPRVAAMREAFVSSAGEVGREAFERTWRQLEPEQQAWAAASRALCQLDPSSPHRRSRARCLAARGNALSSLADVLASADAQVVENAQATLTLEVLPVGTCDASEAAPALAQDGEADRELRPELSRARVLRAAGRYADGLGAALEVASTAHDARAFKVEAEAQLLAGQLAAELRRTDAESFLKSAASLAERAGADDERAAAWVSLVGWYAERDRFDAAHDAAVTAEDVSVRLGRPDLLEAQRLSQLGQLFNREGEVSAAREAFRTALALRRRHFPPAHPLVTRAVTNLALSLPAVEAQPLLLDVLRVRTQTLGQSHPETALAAHNVGVVMLGNGSCEGARTHVGQALAIRQQLRHADPARLGREYAVLARAQECLGVLEAAEVSLVAGIEALRLGGAPDAELRRELNHLFDLLERLERPRAELDRVTEALRQLD